MLRMEKIALIFAKESTVELVVLVLVVTVLVMKALRILEMFARIFAKESTVDRVETV